ncbi:Hypothetical protein A7982_00127 [Minicystis rosea]|nr:Hypothetical protein A7982_00127 [Minicystis rosea]
MSFVIDLDRTTNKSIKRAYRSEIQKASRTLTEPTDGRDRVHDARTSVKKARALLRLTRHDVGGSLFARENDALRDAGRALSAIRDAVVLVKTFDEILERASGPDRALLTPLRAILVARRDAELQREEDQVAEAVRALDQAHDRAADVLPAHRGWKSIARGLDRAYRRAYRRFSRAYQSCDEADFHALRKAVKDLRYQARFFEPMDAPTLSAEGARWKKLGELLGDDHDLAVLRETTFRPEEHASPTALARLDALAGVRQDELREEARRLAETLFLEPPKQRLARLAAVFHQARQNAARAPQPAAA